MPVQPPGSEPPAAGAAASPGEDGSMDLAPCPLCAAAPADPGGLLCPQCRADQRRLFWIEAFGAGFFFTALAAFLYLVGRWYAG